MLFKLPLTILVTFLCCVLTSTVLASSNLNNKIKMWQLFDDNLTLDEVVGIPNDEWQALENNATDSNVLKENYWYAAQGKAIWIKLNLPRIVNTKRVWLELAPNVGLDGKIAIKKNGAWIWEQPVGRQSSKLPSYPASFLTFNLDNPREHRLVFLKVHSSQVAHFSVNLRTDEQQSSHQVLNNAINGIVLGLFILAIIYNLAIGISASEKVFLYYASYVLCTTLYFCAMTGYPRLIFPEWGANGSFSNLTVLLAIFTAILFVRELLETEAIAPKLDYLLRIYKFAIVISIFAIGFVSDLIAYILAETLGVSAPLVILATGIFAAKRKHPFAKLFLVAWVLFLTTSSAWAWMWLGFISPDITTLRIFIAGSVAEIMLLSLLLGYKFAELKRQTQDLNAKRQKYQIESEVDHLTGVYNRQGLYNEITKLLKTAKTEQIWIEINIDDFAKFNYNFGQDIGDKLLIEFGQILKTKVRRDNLAAKLVDKENSFSYRRGVCGRTSGGQFTLLLSNCSIPQARLYCERIMKDFSAIRIKTQDAQWASTTLSIAVGMVMPGEKFDDAWMRSRNLLKNLEKESESSQLIFQ